MKSNINPSLELFICSVNGNISSDLKIGAVCALYLAFDMILMAFFWSIIRGLRDEAVYELQIGRQCNKCVFTKEYKEFSSFFKNKFMVPDWYILVYESSLLKTHIY